MKKYSSYKPSGVEWIGDIPENWIVSKLKYDTTKPVQYGLNISGDNYKEEGIRFIRITDISENGELIEENGKYLEKINVPEEFLLNKFDVLFCRSGHTVGKSYIHLLEGEYTTGGYLVRFNFDNYSNSKFIFYLSKTNFYWDWIKLNSVVSTIENVNGDKYQNFIYPKPTNQEQEQIVNYLDEKTKIIDKLISTKQRKVELLKEQRTTLINQVITKGLNTKVKMKDSGVEWIGEIPESWKISKFKYISEIITGNTPSKTDGGEYYTEDGFLWIKPTYLKGDKYVFDSDEKLTELGRQQTRIIPKDSIMICCIGNTIGKYGMSSQEVSTNQQINSVVPNQKIIKSWYCLYFIDVFTRDLLNRSNFVTLPILTKSDLEIIEIIVPPIKEQEQIVEYLDKQTKEIDDLVSMEQNKIELLKEYRQSLISEVITGKIKVI